MALNLCSIAHQRKSFTDRCVKNGDVRTSCCFAMVTGIPTDFKAFFWAVNISCMSRNASLPLRPACPLCRFEHLPIRRGKSYLTKERRATVGLGSPSAGLKNHRRTVSAAQVNSVLVYMWLTVKIIRCVNIHCK